MARQPFETVNGPLLHGLERLVVDEHRHLLGGPAWRPPDAYRWIRYESADPVGALLEASLRLDAAWGPRAEARAAFEAAESARLEPLLAAARSLGFRPRKAGPDRPSTP